MHSLRMHTRRLTVAAALLLAALAPAGAGAAPYIPGVTDSSSGVLAELDRRQSAEERYIPGVTDSSTGVLRQFEQDRAQVSTGAGDSALPAREALVAASAALAAAAVLVLAAGRNRRVAST